MPPAETAEPRPIFALAAVFVVVGFLLVAAAGTNRAAETAAAPRRAELASLISDREEQVAELDEAVRDLRDEVRRAQNERAAAEESSTEEARAEQLLALAAGTAPVRGPGVVVRLADSDKPPGDDGSASRVHDADLQLVVNELFVAGAEAVSVNGNRLVATSPIRSAGATIVVNFRPVTSPYELVAIGASRERFEESRVAARFRRWRELFDLGFRVRANDDLEIPAYTGRVAITTARPR